MKRPLKPPMVRENFYIEQRHALALRRLAARGPLTKAEHVRRALDVYIREKYEELLK
jgi:hypothetical protein